MNDVPDSSVVIGRGSLTLKAYTCRVVIEATSDSELLSTLLSTEACTNKSSMYHCVGLSAEHTWAEVRKISLRNFIECLEHPIDRRLSFTEKETTCEPSAKSVVWCIRSGAYDCICARIK